ncbi:glycosyltransferase family 87 protein [Sphingomicrobium flavum]|uniref:glycosyltransferase family 87 protein n=1 Tax=Sphingomicrobium flavum TaxID=1229164 RepID=UPI0021ADBA8D|nr:glycosyltransferase family 87 protein [Sphingomicrobium flavum]
MLHAKRGISPLAVLMLAIGLLIAFLLLWKDIRAAEAFSGLRINKMTIWGRDFVNLWSGGRIMLDGQTDILYNLKDYIAWQQANVDPALDQHNYSYPPTSLLYAWLFGLLSYPVALALWLVASAAAFIAAARPWLADAGIGKWAALFLPTTALCLWAGHYGLFFGALWLVAWRQIDRNPALSGIATGLMIIKPHLALLMPLLFVLRGAWRAFAFAALTVGLLVGLSIALFGADLWNTYLTATSGTQLGLVDNTGTYFALMMPSTVTTAFFYGAPPWLAWGLQVVTGLIALGLLIIAPPRDAEAQGLLAAIATFLILPYGFNYDLTVVGLAALLVMNHAIRARDWLRFTIAALATILPPAMLFIGRWDFRPAPIILLMLFIAAWSRPLVLTGKRRYGLSR